MAEHQHYVPILKGKRGEYGALGPLSDAERAAMTPLIEVPPIAWDFANDCPAKSLDAHLDPVAADLEGCWGGERPIFIDLDWIGDDNTAGGVHPVTTVFAAARQRGLAAIPVAGVSRSDPYMAAVREVITTDARGVCLRVDREDLRNLGRLESMLDASREALGEVDVDQVDLILDFKDYDASQASAIEIAASAAITSVPSPGGWRSFVLAGGAFPLNLSDVGAASDKTIPRADWDLWRALALDRGDDLPRRPSFADYAVQHPEPQEIDPRVMRMSANVRYTTGTDWLVLKGRNVRDHGYEQFHDLCADLIGRDEFRGAAFSDGDRAIEDCANRASGPGNATTWRKIATNHHLETVVDQIANLP